MNQVTNIAFIRARVGHSEQFGSALNGLVEPSRREPGCINYDVHRSTTDKDVWCVYENWRSAADLQEHFGLPHMRAFVEMLPDLVEGGLDLHAFEMTSRQLPPKFA
ncbi:putative quinol monooxygenase [Paraburkholderia silviterrae]|uniref:Antibiotic biosynthesis monooxygenase n=1 Tax=Paraburkholderia silviterrae TaxID=2528715 RepID=A0A4R5M4B1_9BURK|nr:putative quinol monooxygenase [Paraburkholderia silviterrae]TDG20171.1 antibiotic biosynthesis monooxygenase [Paraburkholderia silviterrae]